MEEGILPELGFLASSSIAAGRSFCADSKLWRRALGLLAALVLAGVAAVQGVDAADRGRSAVETVKAIPFNLPAQPLQSALEAYSVTSGLQVIYNAGLAAGRRSSRVKGEFTPDLALAMLLAGTGLIPQYKAADGAVLVPDPMAALAPDEIPDDVSSSLKGYYGLVQAGLKHSFCASPRIRAGAYRIALSFWIGSSGNVTRLALLSSTGRADIDEGFVRAVGSVSIGAAPPAGFNQPVILLVTPDLVTKCDGGEPDLQLIRAAP